MSQLPGGRRSFPLLLLGAQGKSNDLVDEQMELSEQGSCKFGLTCEVPVKSSCLKNIMKSLDIAYS